jgi:hypothetical protein
MLLFVKIIKWAEQQKGVVIQYNEVLGWMYEIYILQHLNKNNSPEIGKFISAGDSKKTCFL